MYSRGLMLPEIVSYPFALSSPPTLKIFRDVKNIIPFLEIVAGDASATESMLKSMFITGVKQIISPDVKHKRFESSNTVFNDSIQSESIYPSQSTTYLV